MFSSSTPSIPCCVHHALVTLACSLVWGTLRPSSHVQCLSPPPDCMSHRFFLCNLSFLVVLSQITQMAMGKAVTGQHGIRNKKYGVVNKMEGEL